MSTYNICFHGEIRKILNIYLIPPYLEVCIDLNACPTNKAGRCFCFLGNCTDKELQIRGGILKIFFLFLNENIYCGYSLEAP